MKKATVKKDEHGARICFYCRLPLKATLSGENVRHLDGTKYLECAQALRAKTKH